jgi:tRNA pseudouridine55 synthase
MNGILLVDKPPDFTSHDVVAKLRGLLRERRIGHSGTLDPMATGLLVLFIGRATRAVQFAENHEKEYIAGLRPGIVTDTQDITGTVLRTGDKSFTAEELTAVLPDFTGDIMQIPPMYSAIKIDGKKLYEIARKGGEVERKSRPVTISELQLLGEENGDFFLRIRCSKGTYIRTLCHDIGEKLGTGAALSYLRRTKCGSFSVENSLTVDEIQDLAGKGEIQEKLIPVDTLFCTSPSCTLNEVQKKKCLCGTSFDADLPDGNYRVYDEEGAFLMYANTQNGTMSVIKSFFEI